MKYELLVRDIFKLSGGITVLACDGVVSPDGVAGKRASLVSGGIVRQELLLLSERQMLNQSAKQEQRAIETKETVSLTPEEARSGLWKLAWE
jgi:hypothetical protein